MAFQSIRLVVVGKARPYAIVGATNNPLTIEALLI